MKSLDVFIRKVARHTAVLLMRSADGQLADRLVLTSAEGVDLGGLCYDALVGRLVAGIEHELEEALPAVAGSSHSCPEVAALAQCVEAFRSAAFSERQRARMLRYLADRFAK